MDALTFISHVVSSLAWPVVVITAILVYRVPIAQVILSLDKFEYKDLKLNFRKEVAELGAKVDKVANPQLPSSEPPITHELPISTKLQSEIEQIAFVSPSAAVTLAWSTVESELQKIIMRLAISPDYPPHLSSLKSIELLKNQNLIDVEMYYILQRMRVLRNKAVHTSSVDSGISVDDALEYSKLTMKVLGVITSLTP